MKHHHYSHARFQPDFWIRSYRGAHGRHSHLFHQFLICLNGHIDLHTDVGAFILTNETGVVVSRGCTHEYDVPGTASILAVDVVDGVWDDLESTLRQTNGIRSVPVSQKLAGLLPDTQRSTGRAEVPWRPSQRYLAAFRSAVTAIFQPCPDHRIIAAVGQLEALHDTTPRLREVAAAAGLSPAHMSRLFSKYLGSSPAQLARSRRLQHAAQLVLWADCPIADIAAACGYADQATFTRAFSRTFGLPPGKLRAQHGKTSMQESAKTR